MPSAEPRTEVSGPAAPAAALRLPRIPNREIPPPGASSVDPYKEDIDPVGFAISRTLSHLVWIQEYATAAARLSQSDPERAQQELRYLLDAADRALTHSRRLRDLLLAGHILDPTKRLPDGLAEQ